MKKLLFMGCIALFAAACGNATSETKNSENSEKKEELTVDKTPKRIEVNRIKAEDLNKKFDIDFDTDAFYDGYYEVYLDGDKEVLHGKFELKGAEDQTAYQERKIKEDKKNALLEPIALLGNWGQSSYTGQWKDGKKDGVWTAEMNYYESGGKASIPFDGATGSCSEGSYKGAAEGMCFEYKGKITKCTFNGLISLSKEMECK